MPSMVTFYRRCFVDGKKYSGRPLLGIPDGSPANDRLADYVFHSKGIRWPPKHRQTITVTLNGDLSVPLRLALRHDIVMVFYQNIRCVMADLVKQIGSQAIPKLFEQLGLAPVKTNDSFSINYSENLFSAHVKRTATGVIETVRCHRKGDGFAQFTKFDPTSMSKDDRNDVILKLRAEHMSQQAIGDLLGVSQALVSGVCRKHKA